jgi:hypothetical protein
MARPDGVVIVSERYWAFAGTDGTVREGTMPSTPRLLRHVPLLRGLIRLGLAIAPLVRGDGVTRARDRVLVVAALLLPFGFPLLPGELRLAATVTLTAALLAVLVRGRALRLHGAEHRAITAAEERRLQGTWDGDDRPTRFSPRCGTNFAALALPTAVGVQALWPYAAGVSVQLGLTLGALAMTMELWQLVQESGRRWLRVFLLPGLALQRLTTREPSLADTRVALAAVEAVVRREQAV